MTVIEGDKAAAGGAGRPGGRRPFASRIWPRERTLARGERRTAWTMVSPTVLVIAGIAFVPVLLTINLSLHNATLSSTGSFAGRGNYTFIFGDPVFRQSLLYTGIFTIVSVSIELIIGMGVALVLNRRFRGGGMLRAAVLIPWAFPLSIAAALTRLMLVPPFGILAHLLGQVGLSSDPLTSNTGLLIAVITADVWTSTPFIAVLLLAGLQTIPAEMHEAAKVDGATPFQSFWRITLPLLRGPMLVAVLFRTLQAWAAFDLFQVIAVHQINSLSTYVYQDVRQSNLYMGPGTAAAVFTFVSSLAIALVFIRGFGAQTVQEA
jgi:trehalose/maltose transport system permease protein